MEFFTSAVGVLQTLVIALGAGLGIWGVVNLLEGYGNDNPGAKSQGMKQLMAGGGVALIGHDPYQLLSYLSAMKINFKYDAEIQKMINKVYDSMYQLDIESVHEVRSETHIETDAEGNETEVTVDYDYFILNVRLTSRSVEEVVIQELKDAGVYDLYLAMMQTKGNKPDLF